MRKITMLVILLNIISCGSGLDGEEEMFTYTFILKNKTGINLLITGDLNERTELLSDGDVFQCSYTASINNAGGLCAEGIEIRLSGNNKGFRCFKSASQVQGLCFVEDYRVFTISEGTIFTEIGTRTYEYVLTPDLLEGAFELPE